MVRKNVVSSSLVVVGAAVFVAVVTAQTPHLGDQNQMQLSQAPGAVQDPPAQDPPADPGLGGGQNQPPRPAAYNTVITSAAVTDYGMFNVHRVGDRLYYEIPKAELGKDYLLVTTIKKA